MPMSVEENIHDTVALTCSVYHGYNFSTKEIEKSIGHISSFSFATLGIDLVADIEVLQPDSSEPKKVVAVVEEINWVGGFTSPVHIRAVVTPKNKGLIKQALTDPKGGSEIALAWEIYSYDADETKFYPNFHTDGAVIQGVIRKGTKFQVAEGLNMMVQEPSNHVIDFVFNVKEKSEFHYASGLNAKKCLQAGVDAKG